MLTRFFTILLTILFLLNLQAQENLTYQKPPEEILELADVPRPPSVRIDDEGKNMIFLYRDTYKTISELSEKELRLAGLRINPKTNISSRVTYFKIFRLNRRNKRTPYKSAVYQRRPESHT